ncbi:MAG: hypothetical protein ABSE51_16635 [Terracidiphilus sp.]
MPGALEQGKLSGAAHGTERGRAVAQSSLSPIVPQAESFCAGWQSLLASLGTNSEGLSETVSAPSQGATAAGAATVDRELSAGADLSARHGTEKANERTDAAENLPATGVRTGAPMARSSAGTAKASGIRVTEARQAGGAETKSASGRRPNYSISIAEPDVIAAGPLPEVVPAAVLSVVPNVPAPAVAIPVIPATELKEQSDLKVAQTPLAETYRASGRPREMPAHNMPVGFLPISPRPLDMASSMSDVRAAKATGPEVPKTDEMPPKQGAVTPVSDPNEAFGETLSERVSSIEPKGGSLSAATLVEGGNWLETPTMEQSLTSTEAPPLSLSQPTLALSPSPAQTEVSNPKPIQMEVSKLEPSQTLAPNQSLAQAAVSSQEPVETAVLNLEPPQRSSGSRNFVRAEISGQASIQVVAPGAKESLWSIPSQNQVETAAPNREPAPRTAPSQGLIEHEATRQTPLQTPTPIQNSVPAFVPGQNQSHREASIEDSIHGTALSQSLIQTVVSGQQNPLQTFAPSQRPAETMAPSQSPVQTLRQSKIEIPIEPGNMQASAVPASRVSDGLDSLPMPPSVDAFQSSQIQAAESPNVIKAGSAGGGKVSTSGPSGARRGAVTFESGQHESHLVDGQSFGPSVDASAVTRELAGAHGLESAAGGPGRASTDSTTTAGHRETFAALDAEGSPASSTWIHAGARRAEAGFRDPTLGWIGVRADSSGGGVHAQLVPGSAEAAQTLGGHLDGLNSYLAEHRTPVETLTLTAPESGWSGGGSGQGTGQQMQQGAGQQTGQETGQGTDGGSQSGQSQELSIAASESRASSERMDGGAQVVAGGLHISVVA